ncbi:integrase core domain-containing protein [Leadbetterella byssophila]|uniref:integrase core domain-containing protein n=1 Tax=Leadbetterella byssophila TaxID=316068 RepID=UPI0039A0EF68
MKLKNNMYSLFWEVKMNWLHKPEKIRSDNGPEFVAEAIREWCKKNGKQWEFIQPGKPTQNSLIERFNRIFRQEVLDGYRFDNLPQIIKYAEAWAWMYNNERPHSSLGRLTPTEKSNWNYLVLGVAS